MKKSTRLAVVAAVSFLVAGAGYTVPSYAIDGGSAPAECALDSTKAAHPDWYRDGGYCDVKELGQQPNFTGQECKWEP
jgi:hypothetical protein